MSLFNTRTLSVIRTAGSWVNGKWVKVDQPAFSITGSWQPIPGDVLELAQDSKRSRKIFECFTYTQVFATDQTTNKPSDIIEVDGDQYEIIELDSWQNGIISHYKFRATRILE